MICLGWLSKMEWNIYFGDCQYIFYMFHRPSSTRKGCESFYRFDGHFHKFFRLFWWKNSSIYEFYQPKKIETPFVLSFDCKIRNFLKIYRFFLHTEIIIKCWYNFKLNLCFSHTECSRNAASYYIRIHLCLSTSLNRVFPFKNFFSCKHAVFNFFLQS